MKRVYLLLLFVVTSLGMAKSSSSKIIINPYIQNQTLKTCVNIPIYNRNWIRTDSTKVIFDFIDNNKIIIYENDNFNIFNVNIKKVETFENSKKYHMVGMNSLNQKYNIDVIFFNDKSVFFMIYNNYNVIRYKIYKS